MPPGLGGAMALTASVRREGAALGAGASGRRKEAGAPRNGKERQSGEELEIAWVPTDGRWDAAGGR